MKHKRTDRHGIVQLGTDEDLAAHFLGEEGEDKTPEDFASLIESALDAPKLRQAAEEKDCGDAAQKTERIADRLRRYPQPQEEIDLHQLTAAAAQSRVRYGIADAGRRGVKTLRIITGKGLHSEAGAVLRDVVEQTLVTLKRSGSVLTFVWEKRAKQRSGAVIVYLSET